MKFTHLPIEQQILWLYKRGYSRPEIIKTLNCTSWKAQSILERNGVTRNRGEAIALKGRKRRRQKRINNEYYTGIARDKAEEVLGRKLKTLEVVHHIDRKPQNNINSNLLICSSTYHKWLHCEMKRQWYKKIFGPIFRELWNKGYSPQMISKEVGLKGGITRIVLHKYLGLRRSFSEAQNLRFKRDPKSHYHLNR